MKSAILATLTALVGMLGPSCELADGRSVNPVPLATRSPPQPLTVTLESSPRRSRTDAAGTATQQLQVDVGPQALGSFRYSTYLYTGTGERIAADGLGNSFASGILQA